MPWLAPMAKDCTGDHEHWTIGFDKDIRTENVAAYAWEWCREYAKRTQEFVAAPKGDKCVHCLPQGDSNIIFARREALRRCAEKAKYEMAVDSMDLSVSNSDGQVFLRAVTSFEAVSLTRDKVISQLGARYQQQSTAPPKPFTSPLHAPNSQKKKKWPDFVGNSGRVV